MVQHCFLDHIDVGGSTIIVDVVGVRLVVNRNDLGTGRPVGQRGHLRCRTVCRIHHHFDALQIVGHGLRQMLKVSFLRIRRFLNDATNAVADGAVFREASHRRFDFILYLIGQLVPTSGEELDAVVGHGIVACGNHHPHISAVIVSEECNRWGGQNPDPQDVDTLARHACRQCGGQHLPRHPRVTAHDRHWAPFRRPIFTGQNMRGSCPKFERQRRCQPFIRHSTHAVSSKESSHGFYYACLTTPSKHGTHKSLPRYG